MKTLRLDDCGPEVRRLQRQLLDAGFNPGEIDGEFGAGTRQALLAFQQSEGLLADGIAGPRSLRALGLVDDATLPDATALMTVQVAGRMCPGAPLSNIKRHLPILLDALRAHRLHDRTMVLMAMATIRAESAGFEPIGEGRSRYNSSPTGHPFDLYDFRADLGNGGLGDGERFRGRGFVQLTGRANYRRFGALLRPPMDLESEPDRANQPEMAADLLCLFLADRELQIKDALLSGNFQAARRLVNGGQHGLAAFTAAYQVGEQWLPA